MVVVLVLLVVVVVQLLLLCCEKRERVTDTHYLEHGNTKSGHLATVIGWQKKICFEHCASHLIGPVFHVRQNLFVGQQWFAISLSDTLLSTKHTQLTFLYYFYLACLR